MNFQELWDTLVDKLQGWAHGAAEMLPNIGLALVVGLVLYWVSKGVRKAVDQALKRTRMHASARNLIVSIVHFASLIAVLMITLSILDLNRVVTSLLAGAGVVGLALGFAFQDLAANFISGVGLSVRHPFRVGDIIETNDIIGVVEQLDLRTTRLRTFDGKRVIVPNSKIYQDVLINHTDNDLKRMDLSCGVGYGDDLVKVRTVVVEALNALDARDESREAAMFFTEFGDSSINFTAQVWFDYNSQADLLKCQSEAVIALKKAFDANDITIPFPIRTLDFDPNGGLRLDDVWPEVSSSERADA